MDNYYEIKINVEAKTAHYDVLNEFLDNVNVYTYMLWVYLELYMFVNQLKIFCFLNNYTVL